MIERDTLCRRGSRRQPSILVFLARDADNHAFCYSNADIRKGEERDEISAFCLLLEAEAWRASIKYLVFDSQLTTYENLKELDDLGISFITLRRRTENYWLRSRASQIGLEKKLNSMCRHGNPVSQGFMNKGDGGFSRYLDKSLFSISGTIQPTSPSHQ